MPVLKTSGKPLTLEKTPKPVIETAPLPVPEKPGLEKEKAEKEYYKVDADHPGQSPYVVKNAKATPSTSVVIPKSESLIRVEEILSEHLDTFYGSLDEKKKEVFRKKGEETATAIDTMIRQFKVRAKNLLTLIKEWLSIIPSINKYFLEQEAKIKAQKIMDYARQYKKENKNKW
ncbi:MAG: hypothetical protein WC752_03650 [Patescibacteria group bacterium]|jgi:hypothetical protein